MIEYPDSQQLTPRAEASDAEPGEADSQANNAFEPSMDRNSFMQQRSSGRPSASTTASHLQQQQRERQQPPAPPRRFSADRHGSGAAAQSLNDELANGASAGARRSSMRRARVVDAPPPMDDEQDLLEPRSPSRLTNPSRARVWRDRVRRPTAGGNANEPATRAKAKPAAPWRPRSLAACLHHRRAALRLSMASGRRAKTHAARNVRPHQQQQRQALQNGSDAAQATNAPRNREQTRAACSPRAFNTATPRGFARRIR